MKTVILCGGKGTRLGEHGKTIPKGLVKIGDQPILWHLLQFYSNYNFNEFIFCLGFLGDKIQHHFEQNPIENCRLDFVETGLETNTGGRLKQIERFIGDDENFCVTYGDGLSDVNLKFLVDFHLYHGKIATLTAVHPFSNFGLLNLSDANLVIDFQEKPRLKDWINGGFFVFNRRIFDYLEDDSILEREPFERLAGENELMAFKHSGFWKCMDTYKDNLEFNQLWNEGKADWKI